MFEIVIIKKLREEIYLLIFFRFLMACAMNISMVPLRLFCLADLENKVASMSMLFIGFYFLFFCRFVHFTLFYVHTDFTENYFFFFRGFKTTGPFVIMVYRMLAADLIKFGVMYAIFVMGFAQGIFNNS